MDPRFLRHYNRELQHLREVGGEFAREFPKIAGRLGLESFECADPYVERLLESFAFLTARVQLKLDAEFPHFTQSLLEAVCPNYLAPVPSMVIAQFVPDYNDSALADGFPVDRHERLESLRAENERTSCTYRTAHPVTLWPIRITQAEYYTRELPALCVPSSTNTRAAVRIRLETTAGLAFPDIALDELTFYIDGSDEFPMRLLEQIFAHTERVVIKDVSTGACPVLLDPSALSRVGFTPEEAMLPYEQRNFEGCRLIQEYFAMPQRFMFFRLSGLREAVQQVEGNQIDLVLLFDEEDLELEGRLSESNFALYCTPAVNLFEKRCDRIQLRESVVEQHVIPDRTRPLDFEVYFVTSVVGHGAMAHQAQPFAPMYGASDFNRDDDTNRACFSVQRVPRVSSSKEQATGSRSSYRGGEMYVTLVDPAMPPYNMELRQLAIQALCTNRDLPLHMPIGIGATDFTLQTNIPATGVKCLKGPTPPQPSFAEGETTWRLISQMTPNYFSLVDNENGRGAGCLREMLSLYVDSRDAQASDQIEGIMSVSSNPIVRRVSHSGPIAFARGLEILVTLDENRFQGTGVFLLGMVLESFFCRYVSINCLTETVVCTKQRGEIMRWPARVGSRYLV